MGKQSDDITQLKAELKNVKARLDRIEWFLDSFADAKPVTIDSTMTDERFLEAVELILQI